MLVAEQLTKNFGKIRALDDFHVSIGRGQAVLLIGPNGSGKTTFLKCVLGLVRPDRGTLTLDGESLLADPRVRAKIGYMPQIGRFPDHLRVGQILAMMREIRRGTHAGTDEDLIEAFEIGKFANKPARTLSGGMRQKLSACLAFLFDPEVLILDEPTAGLDPVATETLMEKVRVERGKGKLVLMTSHILSDLDEMTSDVLYLIEGKVRFYRALDELRAAHGGEKLARVVARIMREEG